jgi:hypothetical protein
MGVFKNSSLMNERSKSQVIQDSLSAIVKIMYSLRSIKSAILEFEKNPTKKTILENRSNYLPN